VGVAETVRFDFTGKVALVSGASGALGGVVARRFLDAGARVILPDREPAQLAAGFPEVESAPERAYAHRADLADPEAVDGLVAAAVGRFGTIDVLANVAGGFRGGKPLHETPPADWEHLWRLNASTVFYLSRAVVPVMLDRPGGGGGAIVNVASGSAEKGTAGVAAYAASKAAVLRLTESLSAEVKAKGVRVNAVLPGTIDTAANRKAMPAADTSKWVAPAAVADVILFLASPAARAVHGVGVPVFGLG
jgi:NAD(P)-dependent dehydrogenase (short-subunit alcohol dehydrogenase family)